MEHRKTIQATFWFTHNFSRTYLFWENWKPNSKCYQKRNSLQQNDSKLNQEFLLWLNLPFPSFVKESRQGQKVRNLLRPHESEPELPSFQTLSVTYFSFPISLPLPALPHWERALLTRAQKRALRPPVQGGSHLHHTGSPGQQISAPNRRGPNDQEAHLGGAAPRSLKRWKTGQRG